MMTKSSINSIRVPIIIWLPLIVIILVIFANLINSQSIHSDSLNGVQDSPYIIDRNVLYRRQNPKDNGGSGPKQDDGGGNGGDNGDSGSKQKSKDNGGDNGGKEPKQNPNPTDNGGKVPKQNPNPTDNGGVTKQNPDDGKAPGNPKDAVPILDPNPKENNNPAPADNGKGKGKTPPPSATEPKGADPDQTVTPDPNPKANNPVPVPEPGTGGGETAPAPGAPGGAAPGTPPGTGGAPGAGTPGVDNGKGKDGQPNDGKTPVDNGKQPNNGKTPNVPNTPPLNATDPGANPNPKTNNPLPPSATDPKGANPDQTVNPIPNPKSGKGVQPTKTPKGNDPSSSPSTTNSNGANPKQTGTPDQNPKNGKGKNNPDSNQPDRPKTTSTSTTTTTSSPTPEPTNNNPPVASPKPNNPNDGDGGNDGNDGGGGNDGNGGNGESGGNSENQKPKKPDEFTPPPVLSLSLDPTATATELPSNVPEKIVVDADASYSPPPPDDTQVQLKFSSKLQWIKVIESNVLPSQIVSFVSQDVSKFVVIDQNDIIIRDLQAADDGGVIMTMNIPEDKLDDFKVVIHNSTSPFYTDGSELSKLVDPNVPITADDDQYGNTKPTNNGTGGSSNKGIIIGLSVGASTILYAGLIALVVRAYKKRAMRREENESINS